MLKIIRLLMIFGAIALAGCAAMMRTPPAIGDTVDVVQAKFGQPTAVYPTADGRVLEYAIGPMGQYTWMATIGPDGRMTTFEQVLTGEKFATLKIGKATHGDVLCAIGRPAEMSYLSLPDLEVWSYRYKEAGVWNSMMHVHFDRNGVLKMMQSGPDPMYEERRFFMD
ncbi:hypothetical protein [Massilia cavernae]|uniref:Outer membrane protein assembly factor BamE n=1 Tax=Massilia cavernae TaxID=2320864 RepID=A0A418XFI9_9BURK|nr:hypothetical protein [Massilia cavernae]RJG11230.1 hypothetical protein D3872_20390 [Massilia cavernae]